MDVKLSKSSLLNRGLVYWKQYGLRALLVRMFRFIQRKAGFEVLPVATVSTALATGINEYMPVRMFPATARKRVVNLTIESKTYDKLYNNQEPGLILATLLAKNLGCSLKVITRNGVSGRRYVKSVLQRYQIAFNGDIDFLQYPTERPQCGIETHPADLFVTTSWQSTLSLKNNIKKENLVYLLEEDERLRHHHDEAYLQCDSLYRDVDLNYVIISRALYNHFALNGIGNIATNGISIEPPISMGAGKKPGDRVGGRYNMVLFGDPKVGKSLFYTGLEVLNGLLRTGAIDPEYWDVYVAGDNISEFVADNGHRLRFIQSGKQDWLNFMGEMDLGLALVYGPEPGYLPLTMAANDMVVVTNQYGTKRSLENYSPNILCRRLCVQDLIEGMKEGMQSIVNGGMPLPAHPGAITVEEMYADTVQQICDRVNV